MNRIFQVTAAALLMICCSISQAQQSQDFGQYVVHFNALNTNLIPPEVARAYGIQRSGSRALLNITVLRKVMANPGSPVNAKVAAGAINLTGQRRAINLREVSEPGDGSGSDSGAIYYLGEFRIDNRETLDFTIEVTPDGETEPLMVRFRQQFFTE